MASPASHGNIAVIHRRLGVVSRQNFVLSPVAILAIGRRRVPGLHKLGVIAVRIGLLCVRMALRAGHLLRRHIVRQALHIRVAIHAGEHAAVRRMLELGAIHKQADLLAIHILGQRFVGVALKAVFILDLVLSFRRTANAYQYCNDDSNCESSAIALTQPVHPEHARLKPAFLTSRQRTVAPVSRPAVLRASRHSETSPDLKFRVAAPSAIYAAGCPRVSISRPGKSHSLFPEVSSQREHQKNQPD